MLSIGEFSQITRLTVKTIRYYQELGILLPAKIDPETGYRYFSEESHRRATEILQLKELGFSLKEIQEILAACSTEEEMDYFIAKKIDDVRGRIKKLSEIEERLVTFSNENKPAGVSLSEEISEFTLDIPHLAALEIIGSYEAIGDGFQKLYRKMGRKIDGQPFGFFYDMEYREEDARFEAAVALKSQADVPGFRCGSLHRRAVKTVHKGPYGSQGHAYFRLFEYCREKGITPKPPIIERYIKGPGIIFKRKPKDYITECILLIE